MTRHVRTALALSFLLAAAVGGSAAVNAQGGSTETQVPARFTATLGEATWSDQAATSVAAFEASDPRIAGTWNETKGISVAQLVDGVDGLVAVWWHDITILNAGGSWTGHSEGFGSAADWDSDIVADGETVFLIGGGGYEGLTATLFASEGQVRGPGALTSGAFEGVIFPTGWDPVGF
jgi:hypothetical protein